MELVSIHKKLRGKVGGESHPEGLNPRAKFPALTGSGDARGSADSKNLVVLEKTGVCRESNVAPSSLCEGTKGISSTKAVASNRDSVEKELITHIADSCINDRVSHLSRVVCEELVCVEIYIVRCGIATKDVGHNSCESSSGEAVSQTLAVLVLKMKLSGSTSG